MQIALCLGKLFIMRSSLLCKTRKFESWMAAANYQVEQP
jgi:hypothetical protein